MAFRDSWHRALVYFGLAEERAYVDERDERDDLDPRDEPAHSPPPPEEEIEERYRERPNVRRLAAPRRPRDGDVRVHLVIPKSFNDAQQVADKFKQSIPVVLNLQGTETALAKRLIDFASGLTYALDGGMQRIAEKVFMLTPRNVKISAEERAELIDKGFFNQS